MTAVFISNPLRRIILADHLYGKPSDGCVLHNLMGVSPPVLTRRLFVKKYHCASYTSSHCREQFGIWQQGFSLYTSNGNGNSVSVLSWRTSARARYTRNVPDGLLFSFQCSFPFRESEIFCLSLLKGGFSVFFQRFLKKISIFFAVR